MSTIDENIELDEFHYHEALDRTHVVNVIIEETLVNHPVFVKHTKLRDKLDVITLLLSSLYQEVGSLTISNQEDNEEKT